MKGRFERENEIDFLDAGDTIWSSLKILIFLEVKT